MGGLEEVHRTDQAGELGRVKFSRCLQSVPPRSAGVTSNWFRLERVYALPKQSSSAQIPARCSRVSCLLRRPGLRCAYGPHCALIATNSKSPWQKFRPINRYPLNRVPRSESFTLRPCPPTLVESLNRKVLLVYSTRGEGPRVVPSCESSLRLHTYPPVC